MDLFPVCLSTDSANPSFKLFGQIIPSDPVVANHAQAPDLIDESFSPCGVEELGMSSGTSSLSDEADAPKEDSQHRPALAMCDMKEEESKEEDGASRTLPRPKNLVPCPRCNSADTKFCYFNNYNVNQPRHFCKSCQRYWTAGGMLRNVPVGAGRRKNKHGSSLQKQPVPDNVVMKRVDCGDAQPLQHVSTASQQENLPVTQERGGQSQANLEIKENINYTEAKYPSQASTQVEREDGSARLEPVWNSNFADFAAFANTSAFPFYGMPWPYAHMAMPHVAAKADSSPGTINFPGWNGEAFCKWPPALPAGMYNPQPWPMLWNVQWGSQGEPLRKRPPASTGDSSLCIPKTLRIHDPEAAAQNSLLTKLGVDSDPKARASACIFNAFQPKAEVFQPQPGSKRYDDQRHENQGVSSRSMDCQEGESK